MKNHLLFQSAFRGNPVDATFLIYCKNDASGKSGKGFTHLCYVWGVIVLFLIMSFPVSAQWQNVGPAEITSGEAQFQSLGFNSSNSPHVAFRDPSQSEKASVMYYNFEDETWYYLGTPGFSTGGITTSHELAFSPDRVTPYVVYEDNDIVNKSIVMKYSSGSWMIVGPLESGTNEPGVPERNTSFQTLAIHPNTGQVYVGFQAEQRSSKAMVWRLVGSPGSDAWEFLGMDAAKAAFSDGEARELDLAIHPTTGEPYVAYRDMVNSNGITVHRFDGAEWQVVGTKGFTGSADKPSLAFNPDTNEPYLAYEKGTNPNGVAVVRFDGSSWVPVGSLPFTPKIAQAPSLTFHPSTDEPYVAFTDFDQGSRLSVMKFNGTDWEFVGMQGFSSGSSAYNSLAFSPDTHEPYVAFRNEDNPNDGMSVMKFVCTDPTVPSLSATSSEICEGESTEISVSGGDDLGSATAWHLYTGSCGGTLVESNATGTFTVMPTSSTTYYVRGEGGCITPGSCGEITITVNALPSVSAGDDQTICAGEMVTLTGSGADSYTWDNGVTDGVAFQPSQTTTYTVTGTDANGCSNTDDVTVTVNSLPVVNAGEDMEICDGESVTLTGSGATSYTWDNGITDGVAFTPTTTTTYTVTGTDDNGCMNTDDVTITVHSLPTVDAGEDQEVCEGESITLAGSGATNYTWDNGVVDGESFAASATTTFTVTGTDANGCADTDEVLVTVNAAPNVDAGEDQLVCEGASVTLTASGATSFSWDNGVTDGEAFVPAETTTYTVTGTDANGCMATDEVTVTVEIISDVVSFTGNTLTAEASDATYQWIDCESNSPVSGETNRDFMPLLSGTYSVEITRNGCTVTTECMDVVITGIEDLQKEEISIYPNPTNGTFHINLEDIRSEVNLDILTLSGKVIQSRHYADTSVIEAKLNVPTGIYLLRISGEDLRQRIYRIIRQ